MRQRGWEPLCLRWWKGPITSEISGVIGEWGDHQTQRVSILATLLIAQEAPGVLEGGQSGLYSETRVRTIWIFICKAALEGSMFL